MKALLLWVLRISFFQYWILWLALRFLWRKTFGRQRARKAASPQKYYDELMMRDARDLGEQLGLLEEYRRQAREGDKEEVLQTATAQAPSLQGTRQRVKPGNGYRARQRPRGGYRARQS